MANKYVCIHGHFYQPPRENPWLNAVEIQDSAFPYHDWNERITSECYGRNAASRLLNHEGQIVDIINNYSMISFNIGPTLLQWMEQKSPETYEAILKADKLSQERFSGHGSAIAQVYNHMIMPLANERDSHTQVIWGIKDFEKRFGRMPEGMWLSETAVNTTSLEVLAANGIKFTILSPYQARRFRKTGEEEWKDGTGANIDPKRAYLCNLPSGRKIYLFFYDGPVSQGIAFEGLLSNGESFAKRLTGSFRKDEKDKSAQLMHIATDGESYGHHHGLGEMGLSAALYHIDRQDGVDLTIYGEFLEKYEVEWEAQIIENTSWSCVHGIERWRSNCGCNTGGENAGSQEWRGPLREAFDHVREKLLPLFEKEMAAYADDPWHVRNEYIDVIADRNRENVQHFLNTNLKNHDKHVDKVKILKLLEMQFHAMLMYTSCGWFFDEVTGLESTQDVFYATRALQLAEEITGENFEDSFVKKLENARSNLPEFGNAATAFERFVKPAKIDLLRVGAHYAISSVFSQYVRENRIYSYLASKGHYDIHEAGHHKLAIGSSELQSEITWEKLQVSFAVLHLGGYSLFGGVREFQSEERFGEMVNEVSRSFKSSHVQEVVFLMDKHFESHNYSFWHLFRDEQKRILDFVLEDTLTGIERNFEEIYMNNYQLIAAIKQLHRPIPKTLKITADFTINSRLWKMLEKPKPNLKDLKRLLEEKEKFDLKLAYPRLNYLAAEKVTELLGKLEQSPDDPELIQYIADLLEILRQYHTELDLWKAQNIAFSLKKNHYDNYLEESKKGNQNAENWLDRIHLLFERLNMKL